MTTASFSNDSAPLTGHGPTEKEPRSSFRKRIAVGPKKSKGVSKLWAGLAVSLVGSGILAASLAPHESLVHDGGRLWKPNEDKIPNVSNAPIGAGAAANSALPPHQALATAFQLEARAPHTEVRAATAQLRQDVEECLHEIAASNLKPSSRRLGILTMIKRASACEKVGLGAITGINVGGFITAIVRGAVHEDRDKLIKLGCVAMVLYAIGLTSYLGVMHYFAKKEERKRNWVN
eukprot:GHVT01044018.1.p1 GENE.GHVT01044018.1~~GHVT01044018.1.p1  ORF type:complete len:263 (-),score=45.30 GHVT01044018.1:169-870(-)